MSDGTISFEEAQQLGIKGTSEDDPSGHALAEAAYAAGAVEPAAQLHTFDVTLGCVVAGSRTQAEYVAAILEQHAERLALVSEYSFTVTERL